MIRKFKDIKIKNGTYGTEISFEVYDENRAEEDLSSFTSVKAKFYKYTNLKTEKFGGTCVVSGNVATYSFLKTDLTENGIYVIMIELLKTGYRNIIGMDYNLIVE
jgi:hypothetical protein